MKGLGEKFSPDLFTGTGNFSVPISLPPGRNGFQPDLSLGYSTGQGNGPFGLGWNLGIPGVSRKTSDGLPQYRDQSLNPEEWDTFILSGAEDLVPVATRQPGVTRFRPRTEGIFAEIIRIRSGGNDYWQVRSKDGLTSLYGTERPAGAAPDWRDPATLWDPARPQRVLGWRLTQTTDTFGNRVLYEYERDCTSVDRRHWDQLYLKRIRYIDYATDAGADFLVSIEFEYDDQRPDPHSDYRGGFEVRTRKRCRRIAINMHTGQTRPVRAYELIYSDQLETEEIRTAPRHLSLLRRIQVVGFDDEGQPHRDLPPLEFSYSSFAPQEAAHRRLLAIRGSDLPARSLADPDLELVDLFGNGLPDLVELGDSIRYWRNRGDGSFDPPRPMHDGPAGVRLSDRGVQFIDADGDGRTDLLVVDDTSAGRYALTFDGRWDRRSYQPYPHRPSFDLQDPQVRLVDLDGDGVTDVLRSGNRFECYLGNRRVGWDPRRTRFVDRKPLEAFPDVDFADPRIKWADMSGDRLQDIVLVRERRVEYWPNLGFGDFGARITMRNNPRLPIDYSPERVLLGDIDGDGVADLVYVGDGEVTLWLNRCGNGWSESIVIQGTPPVSDIDTVRLVDLLGTGVAGVLWSRDAKPDRRAHYHFLDLTGGTKPYLLQQMDNGMGALTRVEYAPSTRFYLADQARPETRWKTPLPFPVQVVASVEVIDAVSDGKLTTEYRYHHGYWDGAEREFRGFAYVEQLDSESFARYRAPGLHGVEAFFAAVDREFYSPPLLTRTWFHVGPIGEEHGTWEEPDWSGEYWQGDPQLLRHTAQVNRFLRELGNDSRSRRARRDALRTLRGRILRSESYALDGSEREHLPYTVTEYAYGLREEEPPPIAADSTRPRIFFPHALTERSTQWERGGDPMTQFSFTDDYDEHGQPRQQTTVAVPRRSARRGSADETRLLATHTRTEYARPDPSGPVLFNRVAHQRAFELREPGSMLESSPNDLSRVLSDQATAARAAHARFRTLLDGWPPGTPLPLPVRLIAHTIHHYDGPAFEGLVPGIVGMHGALTRTESLVFTDEILNAAYGNKRPDYLDGPEPLPAGAHADFPSSLGYRRESDSVLGHHAGYYIDAERVRFDFQAAAGAAARGLMLATRDPLGHDTAIDYDMFQFLPVAVTDAAGLTTRATYDYRVLQPREVEDVNSNRTRFEFSPLGLLVATWVGGKAGLTEGDMERPSVRMHYDFTSFTDSPPDARQPVHVRTIRHVHHDTELDVPSPQRDETITTVEFSDGFGRVVQTRTQGEEVRYGDARFGGGEALLPMDQAASAGGIVIGVRNDDPQSPNVVVSGWQTYDNKGRVVRQYEPFFDRGWRYAPTDAEQRGQYTTLYYDPRGQLVRTVNADGSMRRVIYGRPHALDTPDRFVPNPWEVYTYDANDNAGRTHDDQDARRFRHHWNTPASALLDALGRTLEAVERNRAPFAPSSPDPPIDEHRTRTAYDIQGNVMSITDALGRVAFRYHYDLAQRPLHTFGIDNGDRWVVPDALGQAVHQRDRKEALTLHAYDVLNRPVRQWARDRAGETLTLRQRLEYGDGGDPAQPLAQRSAARAANRLGKPARHFDEAGLLVFDRYDFKGNLLDKLRRVIADQVILAAPPQAPLPMSWSPPPESDLETHAEGLLDPEAHRTSIEYDALNRIKRMRYPQAVDGHRSELRPRYNRAGALEQVSLDDAVYVQRIAYDAKGQRLLVVYGNRLMTRYAYDPHTFRLRRLRTQRCDPPLADDYQPLGSPLQDFAYRYDLVGNILSIVERVPGCGIQDNPDALGLQTTDPALATRVSAGDALRREFAYDPLYRLVSATGREATNIGSPRPWQESPRHGYDSGNHGTANQDNAPHLTRRYNETYVYDPASNLTALRHEADGQPAWTRRFGMGGLTPQQWAQEWPNRHAAYAWPNPPGNQFSHVGDNGPLTPQSHWFDANGNLVREHAARHFAWDHSDRLKAFRIQPDSGPASVVAHYLYDASGQRTKKLVRRGAGDYDVTVYVDGVFELHRRVRPSSAQSNNSLHVMDNQQRVALVRVGGAFPEDGAPDASVKYHLGDHLRSSHVVVGGAAVGSSHFINREEFLPFGEASFGSFGKKRFRFTGNEYDEESGLRCHDARYYADWLMRWSSADPAGPVDGTNLYVYACANPASRIDVCGTQSEDIDRLASNSDHGLAQDFENLEVKLSNIETSVDTYEKEHPDERTRINCISGAVGDCKIQLDPVSDRSLGIWSDKGGMVPWYEAFTNAQWGSRLNEVDPYIESSAFRHDLDADLIRSVFWIESVYGGLKELSILYAIDDFSRSVLGKGFVEGRRPMNVRAVWAERLDWRTEDLANPEVHIDIAAEMLKSIQNALGAEASTATIYTVFHNALATEVSYRGLQAQSLYDRRPWRESLPPSLPQRDLTQR